MSGQANIRLLDDYDDAERIAARAHARADLVYEIHRRERERRRRIVDRILQACITVLTLVALWLITSATPEARWGHVVGLASQPFYMAATWRARQWGMFAVAVALCGFWTRGIVNTFF